MRFLILKPLHGWRQFAGEVGIIVLGVLIALAAGQIVEELTDATKRDEARGAIRNELGVNLDQLRRRLEVQPCVDARLKQLETLLVTIRDGAALPRPLWVGRPQVWEMRDTLWQAATSGARTALLPPAEQARYATLYETLDSFGEHQKMEQLAWAHLRALGMLPRLDEQARASQIEALQEARYANFRIKVAAGQAGDAARNLGLKPIRAPFPEGSRSVCIPMNTPTGRAMQEATKGRSEYGEP